jgi:hypothetical protein
LKFRRWNFKIYRQEWPIQQIPARPLPCFGQERRPEVKLVRNLNEKTGFSAKYGQARVWLEKAL